MTRTATALAILLARAAAILRSQLSTAVTDAATTTTTTAPSRASPLAAAADDAVRRRRLQTTAAATTTTAIIAGTVYKDLESNGMRDDDDPPVMGVGATLFSCATGSVVSETITAEDGTYSLTAPTEGDGGGGATSCYYVQFEVGGGSYGFTTPPNGETSDIYVASGGGGDNATVVDGVDAGIAYRSTYSPTYPEGTPSPTRDYGSPPATTTDAPATAGGPATTTADAAAPAGPAPSVAPAAAPTSSDAPTSDAPTSGAPTSDAPTSDAPTSIIIAPTSNAPTSEDDPTTEGGEDDDPDSQGQQQQQQQQQQPPSSDVLRLESTVLVRLYDASSQMDEDASSVYESVCMSFLNYQLSIATPPLYGLSCTVVGEEEGRTSSSSRRRRRIRGGGRGLAEEDGGADEQPADDETTAARSSMDVETRVAGMANATSAAKEPSDVKFTDLLVGTFNVQGYLFLEELQAEDGTSGYFDDVGEVRGSYAEDVAPSATTDDDGEEGGDAGVVDAVVTQLSHVHIGVIAAACAILLCCCICGIRRRRRRKWKDADASGERRDEEMVSPIPTTTTKTKTKLPPIATKVESSPVSIDASLDGVETGLQEVVTASSSSSSDDGGSGPILRDVSAPPGKLGIVVANAFRPNATNSMRYGPAVFSLKDDSPMIGLIRERDVIVSINGVDTTNYTVEELTRTMMDTACGRRMITVLSSHR